MKKGNPTVGVVIGAILVIMLILLAYIIYCAVYTASNGTDYAYLGDYALNEPKRSLTNKEYNRLKELQKNLD